MIGSLPYLENKESCATMSRRHGQKQFGENPCCCSTDVKLSLWVTSTPRTESSIADYYFIQRNVVQSPATQWWSGRPPSLPSAIQWRRPAPAVASLQPHPAHRQRSERRPDGGDGDYGRRRQPAQQCRRRHWRPWPDQQAFQSDTPAPNQTPARVRARRTHGNADAGAAEQEKERAGKPEWFQKYFTWYGQEAILFFSRTNRLFRSCHNRNIYWIYFFSRSIRIVGFLYAICFNA